MKRLLLLVAACACLTGVSNAQRHIEFKWHGFYTVADFSFATNLTSGEKQYSISGSEGMSEALKDGETATFADKVNALSAGVSVGYQFRKEACIGVGASYFFDPSGAFTQVPVFFELRSHILRSQWCPYVAIQGGYTFPAGTSSEPPSVQINEGGFYFGFEAGVRYAINRKMAVGAHLGYRLLQAGEVSRSDINNVPLLAEAVQLHMLGGGLTLHL